jgi:hypothetical protein
MPIPLIGAALPAIGSFLAGKGLDLLSNIFRGTVDAGMKKVADTIKEKTGIDITDAAEGKLTEEQIIKLKEFELQHEEMLLEHATKMREMEIEEEKVHKEDRISARDMQKVALMQEDKFSKRFIYIYSLLITVFTFTYISLITFVEIGEANRRIVDTVLGFLLGVSLSAIIQFFFGSSKGSSDKQQQISTLTEQIKELSLRGR